jgi:hypothetical protein
LARYERLRHVYFIWITGIGKENPLIRAFVEKDYGDFAFKAFGDFSDELESDVISRRGYTTGEPIWRIGAKGDLLPNNERPAPASNESFDYDDGSDDGLDGGLDESIHIDGITHDMKRLISTLAWLGKQYLWYQTFAAHQDLYYLPHPLRDFFAAEFFSSLDKPEGTKYGGVVHHAVRQFSSDAQRSLEGIGLGTNIPSVSVPTFLPLTIKMSSSGKDYLDTVSQLRSQSTCVELRAMLNEVKTALSKGDLRPYRRLHGDIDKIGKNILRERGFESTEIRLSPPWKLIGISPSDVGVEFPKDSGISVLLPASLYKQFFVGRRYRVILKDILQELAIIPTLAEYKDKLNGYAQFNQP